MKILCAYSSIEFNCEHFPGALFSREAAHPIFNVPQKKLLGYMGKWASGGLTPTDSYLLFLALLKSTDLVEFRVPAMRGPLTESLISQGMEKLALIVAKINTIHDPELNFPLFVISPETKELGNVDTWLGIWESAYQEIKSGKYRDVENRKLVQREAAIVKLISAPGKSGTFKASGLADWASVAGNFPTYTVTSPFSGLQISISDYWKQLIIRCIKEDSVYFLNRADVSELLEHCETVISAGTSHGQALLSALRKVNNKLINFMGIDDFSILTRGAANSYSILSADTSHESANIRAIIESAPSSPPVELAYKTRFLYLKAKFAWDMAQKFKKPDGDV